MRNFFGFLFFWFFGFPRDLEVTSLARLQTTTTTTTTTTDPTTTDPTERTTEEVK